MSSSILMVLGQSLLRAIVAWLWPLAVLVPVEGTLTQQLRAYEHNRQHAHVLLTAALRWAMAGLAVFGVGVILEQHVSPWMSALAYVPSCILGTGIVWALASWLLLRRPLQPG